MEMNASSAVAVPSPSPVQSRSPSPSIWHRKLTPVPATHVSEEILRDFGSLDEEIVLAKIEKQEKSDRKKTNDLNRKLEIYSQELSFLEQSTMAKAQSQGELKTPEIDQVQMAKRMDELRSLISQIKTTLKTISQRKLLHKRYKQELDIIKTETILNYEETRRKLLRDAKSQFLLEKVEKQRQEKKLRERILRKEEENKTMKEQAQKLHRRAQSTTPGQESNPESPQAPTSVLHTSATFPSNKNPTSSIHNLETGKVKGNLVVVVDEEAEDKFDVAPRKSNLLHENVSFDDVVRQYASANGVRLPTTRKKYSRAFSDFSRVRAARRGTTADHGLLLPALDIKFLENEKSSKPEFSIVKSQCRLSKRVDMKGQVESMFEIALQRRKEAQDMLHRNSPTETDLFDRSIEKYVPKEMIHESIDKLIES